MLRYHEHSTAFRVGLFQFQIASLSLPKVVVRFSFGWAAIIPLLDGTCGRNSFQRIQSIGAVQQTVLGALVHHQYRVAVFTFVTTLFKGSRGESSKMRRRGMVLAAYGEE